jgi:diguanylate cyclase (GGDEF)-like protein
MSASASSDGGKLARGAAPGEDGVTHIDVTELPRGPVKAVADRHEVVLHADVLRGLEEAERALSSFRSIAPLLHYLLEDLPAAFDTVGAELRLHDPEHGIAALVPSGYRKRPELLLLKDSYALFELFDGEPEVTLLDLEDPRMFRVLRAAPEAVGAVLLPLTDGNHLLGTYHLAIVDGMQDYRAPDLRLFGLIAELVVVSLRRVMELERAEQLALLEPATELANGRGLQRELRKEISRARRSQHPVALQLIVIDDLDYIARSRGEVSVNRVARCVAQRLGRRLRGTDVLARVAPSQFAVLLSACGEPQAHEIAERLRGEFVDQAVDDGRGAVIDIALSVGLVVWDPKRYALDSAERLAEQMHSAADVALARVVDAGGNAVSVSRLGLLML